MTLLYFKFTIYLSFKCMEYFIFPFKIYKMTTGDWWRRGPSSSDSKLVIPVNSVKFAVDFEVWFKYS